jgi:hypothetical protein
MSYLTNLPPQQLPFYKKNKDWRKRHLDWADSKTFFNYSLVRKSVIHKKINYDLLNGKLHMSDLQLIVNPDSIKAGYIPDRIQHYPIMNSKLNVLRGEESKRIFDYKVIITNPNAISQKEERKKEEILQKLTEVIQNTADSEEKYQQELEKLNKYSKYDWQDLLEVRANELLKHYMKEYNMPLLFNNGFVDAMTVGEEIYQCDIIGGEPTIERINPLKIRVFKSGYSNKVEDADIIIIEDYWSPGKVIDAYYDVLSKKDIEYIEKMPDHIGQAVTDSLGNLDERQGFVNNNMVGEEISADGFYFNPFDLFSDSISNSLLPYDMAGNLRVIRMYWKSKRKIKKVKSYDTTTGEEIYTFYPETYVTNIDNGEEEQIFYINEAWEGTKIGADIYVNMRPRVVQYNRLSNPSRCHFGIIGTIYNINESRPFSLVDMMKPYNYFYDMNHDRLNKMISRNWGKILNLDIAKVPKGWDIEKWMYYAKVNGIAVVDSFKEGNIGSATGKLAGVVAQNTSGVIDAEFGNSIQQTINLLEFIKMEMAEVAGISRQREGQISNRETVGGVERANLQSNHITEWLFIQHDDVKRRALECFLETAKIALKGRSKKFQSILSDGSSKIMEIEGDSFADADYGLLVDNSDGTQQLAQKLDMLAQAALQNQKLTFSTIMKLYNSSSLAEKQRMVELDEQNIQEQTNQAIQKEQEANQQLAELSRQQKLDELQQKEQANIRDNETKLLIAQLQIVSAPNDGIDDVEEYSPEKRQELLEKIRQFNAKLKLEEDKLTFEKTKHQKEISLKEKALKNKNNTQK